MAKRKTYAERIDLTLTDEMVAEACAIVERGNFRYVAAQRLGVSHGTWASWLERGRKELREHTSGKRDTLTVKAKLVVELERAEAQCHERLLQDVLEADDPRLKMDFLKARYGKLYSRNPNARIDDETGEKVKIEIAEILADKLSQFMDD